MLLFRLFFVALCAAVGGMGAGVALAQKDLNIDVLVGILATFISLSIAFSLIEDQRTEDERKEPMP